MWIETNKTEFKIMKQCKEKSKRRIRHVTSRDTKESRTFKVSHSYGFDKDNQEEQTEETLHTRKKTSALIFQLLWSHKISCKVYHRNLESEVYMYWNRPLQRKWNLRELVPDLGYSLDLNHLTILSEVLDLILSIMCVSVCMGLGVSSRSRRCWLLPYREKGG